MESNKKELENKSPNNRSSVGATTGQLALQRKEDWTINRVLQGPAHILVTDGSPQVFLSSYLGGLS